MGVITTPLGFRKPDGKELVRNMDDEISHNAQVSQNILGQVIPDVDALKKLGGFQPGDVSDATMTLVANDAATQFRGVMESLIVEETAPKLDKSALDASVAASVPDQRTATGHAINKGRFQDDTLLLRFGLNNVALQNVVVLGSSTSNGTGASRPELAYVPRLSRHLHAAYPLDDGAAQPRVAALGSHLTSGRGIQVVGAAAGNATSANYCDATKRAAVGAINPACVIHMIGSNDYYYGTTPADYEANIRAAITGINAAASSAQPIAHVLVNAYQRRDSVATMIYPYNDYRDRMMKIASDTAGVRFIDVAPPFAAAGIPASDPYVLLPDNVHTNDQGHKIIADRIRAMIHVPGTADVGGEWRDLTLETGYTHRDATMFRAQYRVINGLVVLRGGIAKTDGSALTSVSQLIARLPDPLLAPEFQRTSLGTLSTRDSAQMWVVGQDIRLYPNVGTATFVMLDTFQWPLRNY